MQGSTENVSSAKMNETYFKEEDGEGKTNKSVHLITNYEVVGKTGIG